MINKLIELKKFNSLLSYKNLIKTFLFGIIGLSI
jgi:hypothetical protein